MGRQQFEQIIASAKKEEIVQIIESDSANLSAGASSTIYVYAPVGYVQQIKVCYLRVNPPSGSLSGTHHLWIGYQNAINLEGKSTYNTSIKWDFGHFLSANSNVYPPSNQYEALKEIEFDNTYGLRLTYDNNTDASQGNARNYTIVCIRREVA